MILHLGKDSVIPLKDIVAIIDKESSFKSEATKRFFECAQERGTIENVSDDVKTYIVTEKTRKDKKEKIKETVIYTSNISSMTLKQRAGLIDNI